MNTPDLEAFGTFAPKHTLIYLAMTSKLKEFFLVLSVIDYSMGVSNFLLTKISLPATF